MRGLLALFALVLGAEARAACEAPYGSDALLADLVKVEAAVKAGDGATALGVADRMEAGFACLDAPMPYMVVSRAYRAVAAGKVVGGDAARGNTWFLVAIQLDPGFEYGLQDMGADNPARLALESQRADAEIAPTALEGRTFQAGATYYLDGSLLGAPRATVGRPHVFQVKTDSGVTSAVIEGNAFPETALVAPVVVQVEPEPTGKTPRPKPVKPAPLPAPVSTDAIVSHRRYAPPNVAMVDENGFVIPPRPAEKTPLLIAGAGTLAAAGGLYAWSAVARQQFDDAPSRPEAEKFRTMTNNLAIASGLVLVAGAGVLTWGIIVDDSGRPLPGVHFEF